MNLAFKRHNHFSSSRGRTCIDKALKLFQSSKTNNFFSNLKAVSSCENIFWSSNLSQESISAISTFTQQCRWRNFKIILYISASGQRLTIQYFLTNAEYQIDAILSELINSDLFLFFHWKIPKKRKYCNIIEYDGLENIIISLWYKAAFLSSELQKLLLGHCGLFHFYQF